MALMPKRNGHGIELLADPTRRAIVVMLAMGVGEPSRIARLIDRSHPATTRQLRLLQKAGLVVVRRHYIDGRMRIYMIEPGSIGKIMAWLAGTDVGRVFPHRLPGQGANPGDVSAWAEGSRFRPRDGREDFPPVGRRRTQQ